MQLRIKHADGREEYVKLDKAKPLRIGSDSSADVVVSGRGVLAVHVGVAFRDGAFTAMASKAAQTIDVNGQPTSQAPLEEGDSFKLGAVTVTAVSDSAGAASSFEDEFGLSPEAGSAQPAGKTPPAPQPVDDEFGLALDDDDHAKPKPAAKPAPKGAEKPAEKPASKLRSAEEKVHRVTPSSPQPTDDEFGLAPDDDAGHGHGKPSKPATPAKPASAPAKGPKTPAPTDDEFGLALDDDAGHGKPAKPAAKPEPAKPAVKKPADEDEGLGEIGLSPVEDEGHGKKPAKAPAKPGAKGVEKPPAGKPTAGKPGAKPEPAKPAAKAPAGKGPDAKKAKPAADDDFGLTSVDPLGDGGLEPMGADGLEELDSPSSFDEALGEAPATGKGAPAAKGAKGAKGAPAKAGPAARPRKGKSGPGFGQRVAKALQTPAARKTGLALGALASIGLVAFVVSSLPTADASFNTADQEFQTQQYTQANESFQKFLASYPGDPRVGEARAKKGLSQLIPTLVSSTDWTASLRTAEESLAALGPDARNEAARAALAESLPKIAQNLADRAASAYSRKQDSAPDMFEEAQRALALVLKHVSPADRRSQGVPAVEVKMFRLEKDLQLSQTIAKAVAEIKAAAQARKLAEAYELRTRFLASYPRMSSQAELEEAMRQVAEAATAAVEQKALNKSAIGSESTGAVALSLALAARAVGAISVPAGALPAVVAAPGEGTVYGVDLAKGTIVWRRFVGFAPRVAPTTIGDGAEAKVLLVDGAAGELVLVEQATGKLVWRSPIEGIVAAPAIGKSQAYVPTARGAVVLVNLKNGALISETLLPQPIASPPAIEESSGRVYQLGDHSNLYVLAADGKCEAGYSVGHEPGSVRLAPIVTANFVIVPVDDDAEATTLRVFQKGRDFKPVQSLQLAGHLSQPPLVLEKMLYLPIDGGGVLRSELDPSKTEQPLTALSPLPGLPDGPPVGLALVGRELWAAGKGLSIFTLPLVGEGTPRRLLTADLLVDAPRSLVPGKPGPMVLVRSLPDWPGLAVSLAASADDVAKSGEIRLASIAGPARPDAKGEKLTLVHPAGSLESVAIGVLTAADAPVLAAQQVTAGTRPLAGDTLAWDDSLTIFVPGPGADAILVHRVGDKQPKRIGLPGPAAGVPVCAGDLLLVAVERGPLFLVDPAKGAVGEPFWPKLSPGRFPQWRGPAEIAPGQFVVSDGLEKIYRVSVSGAKLEISAEAPLEAPLVSTLAAAGKLVWGADSRGQLIAISAEDLKPAGAVPLDSPLAWGPVNVGGLVLAATSGERLIAVGSDPTAKWQVDLPQGAVAGAALAGAGKLLLAGRSGAVWGINLETGESLGSIDTGLPLAGSPVVASDKVLVTGRDGTIHVLSASVATLFKPKAAESAAASAAP